MSDHSTPMASPRMALSARRLGGAGLIPQILIAAVVVGGPPTYGEPAMALALCYAAVILSFIGGAWWGLAARAERRVPLWIWVAAVAPSLIALGALAAFALGWSPRTSLMITGAALVAALAVDARLAAKGFAPPGWLRLRTSLSLGLGGLTLFIALMA